MRTCPLHTAGDANMVRQPSLNTGVITMNFIRKLVPLVAAVGISILATAAHADVLTPFDVKDGSGGTYVAGATALDWSSKGTGVAVGVGPFSSTAVLPTFQPF